MMPMSTKSRFASRIVVFLASQEPGKTVSKYEIAQAEAISPYYVQQIMTGLMVGGLVASRRGRAGGFSLACNPETTSIADVLRTMEGRIALAPCDPASGCERSSTCPTRDVWMEAAGLLDDLFERTTIAALARDQARKKRGLLGCDSEGVGRTVA
jgi:Rrf2 family transcriptional regulator, iron-sulfur cluster assembly transcription factor